jgi:lambda family phage portal protein
MTEVKQQRQSRIESAIAFISPSWAARRAVGRMQWQAVNSHRGGVQTRVSTPWGKSTSFRVGGSGDYLNLSSRRDRSRRVYEENPIGASLLDTETDNIVADGFRLQAKTSSPDFNREAEEKYAAYCDKADLRGLRCGSEHERQIYRSSRRDGDGLVVLVDRGGESREQFIPADLIQTPYGKYSDPNIVQGIEVDSFARPIAFHVATIDQYGKQSWDRIPAANAIYLAPDLDKDLAIRGSPCYSKIFPYLDGLDGYIDAVVIAARMAAVFGLIFKEATASKQFGALGTLQNSQGQQQKAVTLENGMIKYVGQGDDVVQVNPGQPMQQTPDFIRIMCRLIGLPFSMPLELVLKDMSQVNFASARIGLLGYYRHCRARQKWFRTTYLDRRYQWWISREQKRQALGMPGAFVSKFPADYWPHKFIAVGWDYTDPVSEAQADLLQMDMGTKSPQMVSSGRGWDWEETQADIIAARAFRRIHDLPEINSTLTRHPQSGVGATGDPLGTTQVEPAKPSIPNQEPKDER